MRLRPFLLTVITSGNKVLQILFFVGEVRSGAIRILLNLRNLKTKRRQQFTKPCPNLGDNLLKRGNIRVVYGFQKTRHCVFFVFQIGLDSFPHFLQRIEFGVCRILLHFQIVNDAFILINNFLLLQFDFGVAFFVFSITNRLLGFFNGCIVSSPNPLSVLIHTDVAVHQNILKLGLRLCKFKFLLRDVVFKFLVLILTFEFTGDVIRLVDFIFCQHFKLIQIVVKETLAIGGNILQLGRHLVVIVFVEHCITKRFVKIINRRKGRFQFLVNFVKTVGNIIQDSKECFVKCLDGFIFLNTIF